MQHCMRSAAHFIEENSKSKRRGWETFSVFRLVFFWKELFGFDLFR